MKDPNQNSKNIPRDKLTHFTQSGNSVITTDMIFTLKNLLEGRGQSGFAGFFENNDAAEKIHLLIKEDDPATCVLEGSAGFAKSAIPVGFESSVNFAWAGTLESENSQGSPEAISIQKKAEGYEPWDKIVFGKKRNPKAIISDEFSYKEEIFNNIQNMHDKARFQLAVAIFISTMVGDESLHIGQFMAKKNSQGQVTDIMRIDFGARERYGLYRQQKNDFKHETSEAYKGSGQLGKDYIYYLLAYPDLKLKYLNLWAQDMDIENLGEKSKQEFIQQISNIPQEKKNEALERVWKTLSLESSLSSIFSDGFQSKKPNPLTAEAIGNLLKNIVITRITEMQLSARTEIALKIVQALNGLHKCPVFQVNPLKSTDGQPTRYQFILKNDQRIVEDFSNVIFHLGILSESDASKKKCYPMKEDVCYSSMIFSENQFIQLQNKLWPELNFPVTEGGISTSTFFTQSSMPNLRQQFLSNFNKQDFNNENTVDVFLSMLSHHTHMDYITKMMIIGDAFDIVKRKSIDSSEIRFIHNQKLSAEYHVIRENRGKPLDRDSQKITRS